MLHFRNSRGKINITSVLLRTEKCSVPLIMLKRKKLQHRNSFYDQCKVNPDGEITEMFLSFQLLVLCFTLFMHKQKSQAQQLRLSLSPAFIDSPVLIQSSTQIFCHLASSGGSVSDRSVNVDAE